MRRALSIIALVLAAMALASCGYWTTVTTYHAVYRDLASVRAAVSVSAAAPDFTVAGLGKMAMSPDGLFLFVNERNVGVRVASLADPASPAWVGFVEIPGCLDIAVLQYGDKEYLYADSFVDLVVIELSLPRTAGAVFSATEAGRELDVFPNDPYQTFPEGLSVWFGEPVPADKVVVGYTMSAELQWASSNMYLYELTAASASAAGKSGSMARFALHQDSADASWYLYAVDDTDLRAFSLAAPADPAYLSSTAAGWSIETIYPYKDLLFMGSSSALYVYDVSASPDSSPSSPRKRAELAHFTARDPVVVGPVGPAGQEKDTAFVTLSEDRWGWGANVLIAVDLSVPTAPVELVRRSMLGPQGLGLLGNTLFVCEGYYGLKALDVSLVHDTAALLDNRLKTLALTGAGAGATTFDVIPGAAFQTVVCPTGIYTYSFDAATGALTALGGLEAQATAE